MALSIKNEEAVQRVRELAARTGESLTTAIDVAVSERLRRLSKPQGSRAERLLAIGKEVAPRLQEPYRTADHGDLLYDEDGLPR